MLKMMITRRIIKGVKAGAQAKAQGAETKVSVAKAVNAATGIREDWVVIAIDTSVQYGPIAIEGAKKITLKVKARLSN